MPDPREVLTRPGRPPDLTLAYGPLAEHVVDLRFPAGPARGPLVVVVHGGFWRREYDRAHAAAQSEGLAEAGYLTATVEFRRTGMPGGGWPGTFDDTALWSDTLETVVAEALGGHAGAPEVTAGRMVLVGHSAGGHLAAWAASRHRLPSSSPWHRARPLPLAGVVSLAGVLDLAECDRLHLGADAARALLGVAGAVPPERLAVTDPSVLLPTGVPMALVHGTQDTRVPVSISRSYAAKSGASLRALEGLGHFELIDPLSSAWPEVLAAIEEVSS